MFLYKYHMMCFELYMSLFIFELYVGSFIFELYMDLFIYDHLILYRIIPDCFSTYMFLVNIFFVLLQLTRNDCRHVRKRPLSSPRIFPLRWKSFFIKSDLIADISEGSVYRGYDKFQDCSSEGFRCHLPSPRVICNSNRTVNIWGLMIGSCSEISIK